MADLIGQAQEQARQPPPGWYDNPSGQGQRWWDGTQWTDATKGTQDEPLGRITGVLEAQPSPFWFAVLGLVVMFLSVFAPWGENVFVSASGMESDGPYFLAGSALALGAMWGWAKKPARGTIAFPLLVAVAAIGDGIYIATELEKESYAEIGWGLYAFIGSGAVVAYNAAVLALKHSPKR